MPTPLLDPPAPLLNPPDLSADFAPPPAASDPEMQQLYQEAVQRGLFRQDPEMQQLGHELRARGIVADPTQGGLVQPLAAPVAPPMPVASPAQAPPAAASPAQAAPAPPKPATSWLQQLLGNVGPDAAAVWHGIAQTPDLLLKLTGNDPAQYSAPTLAQADAIAQGSQQQALKSTVNTTVGNVVGPQSMIGHGYTAAQQGPQALAQFAKGVPAGIGAETVQHPEQQVLNVLSVVGAGEMTLSAGGRSLLSHAGELDAAAAKAAATGDASAAAQFSDAAARARAAGQALNRTAFQLHRGATLGPVGDVVRGTTARVAEQLFPGSTVAQTLRYNADFQKAGATSSLAGAGIDLLKQRAYLSKLKAATDAEQARNAARAGAVNIGKSNAEETNINDGTPPPSEPLTPDTAPGATAAPQEAPPQAAPAAPEPVPAMPQAAPRVVNGVPQGRQKPALGNPLLPAAPVPAPPLPVTANEPPAPVPTTEPPPAAIDLSGMGKGMTDNLFDQLFEKVKSGETQELGQPSTLLQVAKPLYEAGKINSPEDLKQLSNDVMGIKSRLSGPEYQAALNGLVKQRLNTSPVTVDGNAGEPVLANAPAPNVAPAPNAEAASATAPLPTPRLIENFPTDQLHTDPERFQYKIGSGQGGQTGSLSAAPEWNPNMAGVLHVWKDPADGLTYVVNGHNRLAFAQRVGQPSVDVRMLDAPNAEAARTQGAIINIGEGQGTAIDAAKLFRDQSITPEYLKSQGVNLTGQKAAQGMALANLSPSLFGQVTRGELPIERAAIIGEKLPNVADQQTLITQLDKAQRSGRTLTNGQISELAENIASGPRQTATQSGLFGDEETTSSIALERAEVSDYLRSQMGKEGSAFKAAADNADRLAKGNNVIDAETSRSIAALNAQGRDIFDRLKNAPGPISDILTTAAQRIAKGEKPHVVKSDALAQIQAALPALVKSYGADAGGAGASIAAGRHAAESLPRAAAGFSFDEPAHSAHLAGPGDHSAEPAGSGAAGASGRTTDTRPEAELKAAAASRTATDPLAESDAAPEPGAMPPTPAAPPRTAAQVQADQHLPYAQAEEIAQQERLAALPPEDHAAITENLAKVMGDPEAAPAAAALKAQLDAARASLPHIASSAGLFGGKAVSDILESATDRIGAGVSVVTSAARESALARAMRNGRFRGSYEVDKAAGDAVNELAASGESAHTYAHYAAQHILDGLDKQQQGLLVDHLLDERAKAIEAAGGTPNRSALRALTPQEVQQVTSDPKIQAALIKFENGPMGTIQRLRQFVSPRMALTQTDSGRFLSLLAKKDAAGNVVNDRAGAGRPASGMAGRGTVKGTSHAQQATGTAEEYSKDIGEILTHDMTEVNKKANLKQYYKTLLARRDAAGNRLAYSSALGQKLPETITFNGKEYPAVDVKPGYKYVDKSGKAKEITIRVPAPLASDLEDALTAPKPGNDLGAVAQKVSGLTTSLSLLTPAEITNHVGRLISIASKIAPADASLPQRLAELAVPYVGPRAGALYRLFNTDMSDPENVAVLQRIMEANGGSGRPFAQDIGNSIASKVPGLSKVQHFSHDFLFSLPEGKGLAGFDLRLRVMAEKMRAAAEGNTDPQRVREFANQFGQYTSKPEKLIASLRTIAPFAATSLPLKATEFRTMLGDSGYKNLPPGLNATLRAETLFRGTAGTILGLALLNHLLSGHWPWQNAPGHETDLEAGKDKNGQRVYIAGNRLDPALERPLNTLGAPDMLADLHQRGLDQQRATRPATRQRGPAGKMIEALLKDAARGGYNAAGSSISSPLTQFTTTAATGHDPLYLTRSGGMLPTAEAATKKNGESQATNNIRAALGGLNPAIGAGLHTDRSSRQEPMQSPLWKTVQKLERVTGPILHQDAPKKSGAKRGHGPATRRVWQMLGH